LADELYVIASLIQDLFAQSRHRGRRLGFDFFTRGFGFLGKPPSQTGITAITGG
jgi:hypothetical protein